MSALGDIIAIDVQYGRYMMVVGSSLFQGDAIVSCDEDADPDDGSPTYTVDLRTADGTMQRLEELDHEERSSIYDLIKAGRGAPRLRLGALLINGEPA